MKRSASAEDNNEILIDASESGNVAVVDWLLREQGAFAADVRVGNNAPLIFASYNGHVAVVNRLLVQLMGDDVRAQDNAALRLASKNGHVAVCVPTAAGARHRCHRRARKQQ